MAKRIYISGPMSNLPQLNFPAFESASKRLRELGYIVISPHEVKQTATDWQSCMRTDIKHMMDADMVATLDGWMNSKGARIEVGLAEELGMHIYEVSEIIEGVKE